MSEQPAFGMKRILVAIDGSKNTAEACEIAATIAKKSQSGVVLLHVIPSQSVLAAPLAGSYYSHLRKAAGEMLEKAASVIEGTGVTVRKEIVQGRASIAQTIVEYSASCNSDLVVLGTRGLGGFKRITLGSVSSAVAAHAPCAAIVVRANPSEGKPRVRKILVAVDGSLNSKRAAKAAIALAKTLKTDLGIIHVVQIPGIAYTAGMPIAIGEIQTGLRE